MEILIIVFFSSLVATLLSAMSGGGSSIVSLPIFLWAGIPLPLSIAAHKLCAAFWTPISAYNYLKDKKINWRFLLLFAAFGLIGSYFGVQFVLTINQELLKRIIGTIIFVFVIYTYFKKDFGLKEKQIKSKFKGAISYLVAIIMGFYESIIGSGNGIAFTALTYYTRGFDFIDALGYYFGIAFFWVTFAAILYIQKGYYDFGIMGAAIIGSVIGSYCGSKYAKYKGNKFIRLTFITIGAILGLKLILNI